MRIDSFKRWFSAMRCQLKEKNRLVRWLFPFPIFRGVGGAMMILALGRLGLFVHASGTFVPDYAYGVALFFSSLTLFFMPRAAVRSVAGLAVMALSAGILFGMAVDLIATADYVSTSAAILLWLFILLVIDGVGRHYEC